MIGTWPAGIPNLMALNSSPAIEALDYRGFDPLQKEVESPWSFIRYSEKTNEQDMCDFLARPCAVDVVIVSCSIRHFQSRAVRMSGVFFEIRLVRNIKKQGLFSRGTMNA